MPKLSLTTPPTSSPRSATDTSPAPLAPPSPRAMVLHNRDFLARISHYATIPSAHALCADMDELRERAKLQRVSKPFAQINAAHADRLTEAACQTTQQGKPSISALALRLVRNHLSPRDPHAIRHAELSCGASMAGRFMLNAAYDMGPALTPESIWADDTVYDAEVIAQRERTGLVAQYVHDLFSYLSRGNYSAAALDALAQEYAGRAKEAVSVWYDKLALDMARAGSWENVRILLENSKAWPGVMDTTYASYLDTLEWQYADADLPANAVDGHLHTPTGLLHLAADADNVPALACVQTYLQADKISIDYTDGAGASALLHAVTAGHAKACAWLLKKRANASHADVEGDTALHHVTDASIAAQLIQAEANVDAANEAGERPLHRQNDAAIVRLLLASNADIDALDKEHNSPLFYAYRPETIELLCTHGANLNLVNQAGNSVLHHWIRHEIHPDDYMDTILSLHAGCRTPAQIQSLRTLLDQRDHRGRIVLHNYLRAQHHALDWAVCVSSANFEPLRQTIRLVEYFRNMGAELDIRDHLGRTTHDYVLQIRNHALDWQQNLESMPHGSRRARARVLDRYATWRTLMDRLEMLLRPHA